MQQAPGAWAAESWARALLPWLVAMLVGGGLVACSTPPQQQVTSAASPPPPPPPMRAEPAAAPRVEPPASAALPTAQSPYGAAVEARFPEPPLSYRVPALQEGGTGFNSNVELQSRLQALTRLASPRVQLLSLGVSQDGAPLQALLFTRSADASPAALLGGTRPTVVLVGQERGDEVIACEALMVVAQELAHGRLQGLLDRINVLILPRANPDGFQRGQRFAANGVDIASDHLLLMTPEAQAQARLLRDYQPVLVGYAQEYALSDVYLKKFDAAQGQDALLQYAMAGNVPPFVSKAADEWFRQPLLARLKQQGLRAEWAYTSSDDLNDKTLSMGSAAPESGRNVSGLMNAVGIAVESRGAGLGRLHGQRRLHTQVTALSSLLQSAADRGADVRKLRQYVDAAVSAQACQGQAVVEAALTPSEYTVQMLDPATGADKPLTANWNSALVLRELKLRTRPCGYWLAQGQGEAVARLRDLGVQVQQVAATGVMQGETYAPDLQLRSERAMAMSTTPVLLDVSLGSYYVSLSQPLANLVMAALEPDTPSSYASHGIVTGLDEEARVMAPPAVRLMAVP